ncbi:PAS domain S-box protein [Acidobacterium sp. S8]|uniref:PAS domain S-box protein n=1 Tax=Acidobacterium sp. S8 TaxID=1641854 RepID=UPI00131DEE91|nr:PAS domain S-box protein [Acidobacterium sp. S8]
MAETILAFDWSSTQLGSMGTWEPRLRFALDSMLGCAFPATLQWGKELILFYNDAYIELIGDHHPAALGRPILDVFPEIGEIYEPMARRVLAGESIVLKDQRYRYIRHGRPEDRWFNLSYSPIHAEKGAVVGIFAVGLDTTPSVIAEHARSEAEARLKRVLETDAVGVIFFDYTGRVVEANDVFLRMVGYTREEISTQKITWRTFTPPEWVQISEQQMQNFAKTGRIGPYEKEYFLKDGTRRWMLFAGRDLGDGTIAEYCIDISERRRAEEASRASEQRFRALVQATADVVYQMSSDWTEMRQLRGHDFLADTAEPDRNWLQKYIHPEDHARVHAAVEEAIRTEAIFQLEHRVVQADGSFGWTASRAVPLRNDKGEITSWFGTASDISLRKRTEEALLRSEKLAMLGRLAATIAHEINNPLEATINLLYLIQTSHGLPEDVLQNARAADAELKRVAHITRQSLGFYRESSGPVFVSLSELLDSSIDLLKAKITMKNAIISREWSGELVVRAVSGELRQVFSNLIANAIDAMEPGGRLRIRGSVRQCVNSSTGRCVRVTFADSGRGISPEFRTLIFDPFFSTKGSFGTGLGLWVTKQLVVKHGGSIQMRSRCNATRSGTVFSVILLEDYASA